MSYKAISSHFVKETAKGFICQGSVEDSQGKVASMTGEGSTLKEASQAAIANSKEMLAALVSGNDRNSSQTNYYAPPATSHARNSNATNGKSKFNGGGTKPASPKQIELIEKIAYENGKNAEEVSRKKFGKSLMGLVGSEANIIINELKSKTEF